MSPSSGDCRISFRILASSSPTSPTEHRIDKQNARARYVGTYYPVVSTEITLHGNYHEMPGLKRKLS